MHGWKTHRNIYIGRSNEGRKLAASIWRNPFRMNEWGKDCITNYEMYVRGNTKLMQRLPELQGKCLGCWCAPSSCHGEVLLKLINELPQSSSTQPPADLSAAASTISPQHPPLPQHPPPPASLQFQQPHQQSNQSRHGEQESSRNNNSQQQVTHEQLRNKSTNSESLHRENKSGHDPHHQQQNSRNQMHHSRDHPPHHSDHNTGSSHQNVGDKHTCAQHHVVLLIDSNRKNIDFHALLPNSSVELIPCSKVPSANRAMIGGFQHPPSDVVLHVGTNDIDICQPNAVADSMVKLAARIADKYVCNVHLSELLVRGDNRDADTELVNSILKSS